MKKFGCKFNKVASAMITNLEFLDCLSKQRKKTFISTGMCNLKDIEKAVKFLKKIGALLFYFIVFQSILVVKRD